MNPLLETAEYDFVVNDDSSRRNKLKKSRVSRQNSVNPFLVVPEYDSTIGKHRGPNKDKKDTQAHSTTVNPLAVVSEYESTNGSVDQTERKTKDKLENPFLLIPEYETALSKENTSYYVGNNMRGKRKMKGHTDEEHPQKKSRVVEHPERGFKRKNCNSNRRNGHPQDSSPVLREEEPEISRQKFSRDKKFGKGSKLPRNRKSAPIVKKEKKMTGPWGLSASSLGTSESLPLDEIGGFNWNATPQDFVKIVSGANEDAEEESEESENEVVKGKKLTAAEKRAKALEEEKKMKKKEKELIEAEDNPQSPDHFERLLIGHPNSAELWIKYMGYHAVNADIEKARAVAQRAIKRIDPQLVSAKLDVWVAFLNLDFTFSPPDVFKETFSEALRCNDDYAINSRVLNLYADAKNVSEVDQLTITMTRKYKDKLENWLQCQNALMMVGLHEKARYMLQKALTVMNKKSHITLISRFALLENKYGFSEQAEALFENLLTSFPQRVDLLSVYVDMLVKSGRIDLARSVLERAAGNKLPVRKMKTIYTKWLAFEEANGQPSDVSKVEEAAKKYVSATLKPHTGVTNESKRSPRKSTSKDEKDVEENENDSFDDDDDNGGGSESDDSESSG